MQRDIKRVVVIGASGRVGRMVAAELAARGYEPVNFDRFAPTQTPCEFIQGDLTNPEDVEKALAGSQAVCHMAALPGERFGTRQEVFDINIRGTFNVLEAAAKNGLKKIVFASSIVVYGVGDKSPPVRLPIEEEHPCAPVTTYAMSKLIGETLCRGYSIGHGISAICLRLANVTARERVYANADEPKTFAANLAFAKVSGEDVAQAARLGLEADIPFGAFNIATRWRYREDGEIDSGESVRERARAMGIAEVSDDIIAGANSFSIAKAQSALGFNPGR